MRVAPDIVLTGEERAELATLAESPRTSPRLAQRARMVLLAAQGMQNKDIAGQLGMGHAQVSRWRERYAQWRLPGIENNLPRGAPPVKVDVARLVALTAQGRPDSPMPWSTRKLAEELGVSAATISRHWKAIGQEPPGRNGTRPPPHPGLAGQPVDIVGLYVTGQEHALVLCGDEAAGGPDEAATDATGGTRRVGITALLGALTVLDGLVAPADGQTREAAWLAFLRKVERAAPAGRPLYLLCDNYATHHQPAVRKWLGRHSHIQAHFAATSASWLRMVQRSFREMETGQLRHAMRAAPQLLAVIETYRRRAEPRPFVWVADAPAVGHDAPDAPGAIAVASVGAPAPGPHGAMPLSHPEPPAPTMVESIDAGRLMPPRTTHPLIPREALMARLLNARRQRCVLIQGQAGSGKTSTLLAWRRLLLSLDYDVTWLSLSAKDNEPARFFDCLLASIAQVNPAAVREAALLASHATIARGDASHAAIEHWVISLVQGLASHPRELVLMLDDLHHIDDPRVFQAVQWLLDYAPPNVHLALSSRSALPLSLERPRARGLLTAVDMRDLRFTAEESERFLREQLGSIEANVAAEVHRLTDGWVAGLQRFATDMRSPRHHGWRAEPMRDARAFASYFEREVLCRLPADDLDVLTRTAICQRLCGPLCAAVLGRQDEAAGMSARLARFEADNLFLTQIDSPGHETWYRMHPLLREVLLSRVADMPAAGQQALHTAACAWFGAGGHIDDAVHHAVLAGDVDTAAGMVEGCAYDLLVKGDLSQLASLLRRLPEEEVRRRFGLLLVSAYFAMYTSRFDAAHECLARMASKRATLDDRQRYAEALVRAGLALQEDDPDTVLAMVPTLRDGIPAEADDFSWSCRSNILGWAYVYQGQYDEARAVVEQAGTRGAGTRSRLLGHCITAMSLAVEGRLAQAERTVGEVLQKSDARGSASVGLSCMAAGLLADLLYEVNDIEGAIRLLEPRLNVLERASLPDTVLHALRVLSRSHWLAGRHAQAMACLDRLEAYASRFRLDRLLAEAHALRLRCHQELGEMQGANEALRQLEAIGARHAAGATETARRVLAVVQRAQITMHLYLRDFAAGAARLAEQLELNAGDVHPARAAGLELQMALTHLHLGGAQAALTHLCRALTLGHQLGLVRTLLDVSPDFLPQLDAILAAGPLDPILAFYVRRLQSEAPAVGAAAQVQGAARPGPGTADVLSEREREVLDLAAQAMPNKKIAMVLGLAPETVKWHLKNIYAKLGVSGRGGAAARLRDLSDLLHPASRR
ncbi:IS630 family transposase [Cupriavidus necator]|uniref:IS630 family transposase n=1 Tax=Cupriavidus necator TaxID=106590 RepID=A0A367PIW7_CUPNE|nr:IS630 family transposase [Cupriavidus necator]QQX82776.1 IS630 family transposase [Cupriavidus necator]RCJ07483.1 IS630 family transposase [Cupriavidus necator]